MKKVATLILIGGLLTGLLASGCSASKKPNQQNTPEKTQPAPEMPRQVAPPAADVGNMPTDQGEVRRISDSLAAEASQVNGVNGATVVLSGPMAYVGLDLKSNLQPAAITNIKQEVANRLKQKEKRLSTVIVATDVDTVARLRQMAQGINQGTPFSTFATELSEIGRRLIPTVPNQ